MKVIRVPILIKEDLGYKRNNVPISVGVPFPISAVFNIQDLSLKNENDEIIQCQIDIRAFWPDNSAKWVLIDFQTSINKFGEQKFYLVKEQNTNVIERGVFVKENEKTFEVNTGISVFEIDKKKYRPFAQVIYNDKNVLQKCQSQLLLIDSNGQCFFPEIKETWIEENGPLRCVIRFLGFFKGLEQSQIQFESRIHFFSNKSIVRIEFTLRNSRAAKHDGCLWDLGDVGSYHFKSLVSSYSLSTNEKTISWKKNPFANEIISSTDSLSIYQGSSGGENYNSINHMNKEGLIPIVQKGYKVSDNQRVIDIGERTNPVVTLKSIENSISLGMDKFWQNFPSEIGVNNDTVYVSLFPGSFEDGYELQGGEQKTHIFFVEFGGNKNAVDEALSPILPTISCEWFSGCGVFPHLPDKIDTIHHVHKIIDEAIEGENTFFDRREKIDEYGWRNFGEIYADHEAIQSKEQQSFVSHYNNQYDMIYGFLRQFIYTSKPGWYQLMNDLALHVIDIDIYRTQNDRAEFNGGLFWHTNHYVTAETCTHRSLSKRHLNYLDVHSYGGGHDLEHYYSSGLLYYYFLTGNKAALDAFELISKWLFKNLELPETILGAVHKHLTQRHKLSAVVRGGKIRNDKYPLTRSTGNAISGLVDIYVLKKDVKYLKKIGDLIKGCIHPEDDINSRDLLNAEINWSYNVCLQAIGKFIDLKEELNDLDDIYYYSKECLLHYAEWMAQNEYPYLDKPEILEYPNETWAAQDLRKSCVLYYAAKYAHENKKKIYIKKANEFYENAISTLNMFDSKTLARPIALLLQNYWVPNYYLMKSPIDFDGNVTPKKYPRSNKEFLSVRLFFTNFLKDIFSTLGRTSLKKELFWLKCRQNKHE